MSRARNAAGGVERSAFPESLRLDLAHIRWTPALTERLIREMPKVETHLHIDGALSPRMIKKLAVAQDYAPLASKSVAEIRTLTVVDKPKDSLGEVLRAFHAIYPLLHAPEALELVAYDVAATARRQNIRRLEVRFAPVLNAGDGFTAEQALKAALRGLKRGEKSFGVGSGIIICLMRPFAFVDRKKNQEMLDLAIRYKGRGVVGIDLAGDEAAQPLSDYRNFFTKAKAAGLRTTVHAGEAAGGADLETALEIGVDRIGHATLLAEKPELLAKIKERALPIEVNLTSNVITGAVKNLQDHPVKRWFSEGVPVTLSTDDPGLFGIDLNHEYGLLSRLGFSAEDILTVAYGGIGALFLPEAEKSGLRRRFESDMARTLRRLQTAR